MARNIQSIKVLVNKWSTTVYINFDNGTFGVRSKDKSAAAWVSSGLKDDELAEAKKLAVVNNKWTNWRRPARSVAPATGRHSTEDARDDIDAGNSYVAPRTFERPLDD